MSLDTAEQPAPLDYPEALIRGILRDTRTIAMVGASGYWNRPSFFAMKYLQKKPPTRVSGPATAPSSPC